MAVSKPLRYEIFRRDNHTCRYCGRSAPEITLHVDHVTPTTLGGTDDPANLVTACSDCNGGKAATPPDAPLVADVDQDALRWSDAVKRAAELDRAERDANVEIHAELWDYWTKRNSQWAYPPAGWEQTVDRFIAASLNLDDLIEAADKAMTSYGVTQRNRWRYFCGICWRTIERRQEAARALLSAEDDDE